ncbi:MAG: S41 family peptidase [Anaerolineae bacterium]|nr:S41 family peptidase [Anaerolineae bacterium]
MENGLGKVVRVFIVLALILITGIVAFVAGFGTSMLAETSALFPSPVPTAAIDDATDTPAPSPTPYTPPEGGPETETFDLFWEVWHIVEQSFYGELPDMQTVTYGAIRGMLGTLDDQYTSFIEPQTAEIINEDATGSFQGIGAWVTLRDDGKLELTSIFESSPAERAGLQDGDVVIAVDGESIVGYGIYEAIALIRGPEGTDVVLLVEREEVDEPFDVTVTRAELQIPLVESEMLEGNVAYIRLREFSTTADTQTLEALEALLAQEPVGLILDLRNNPGGWLNQAVSVSDIFLDGGVVLIERSAEEEQFFRSEDGDAGESIPLVVLINGGSASASEIVAGAVQARERGVLIGELSFGKGSVQYPYRLSDGSELRVTVARWFTPADEAIHGEGLMPDIEVPIPEDIEADEDPQLERAVDFLLNGE